MTEQPDGSLPRPSTDLHQRPLVSAPAMNDGDVVLVNDLGYPIGAAQAAACHRHDTPLHLGYACFVFDAEDKVLVVRRAPDIIWYPLTWTTSLVGHPSSAQPVTEAIAARLASEYGLQLHALRLVIPTFRYKATHAGIAENELCPVFIARVSGTFAFASPDNDHYAWIPWRVFRDDVLRGRRHVSPWCTLQIAGVARMGDDPARWPACLPSELPPAMMYSGAWDSPDFGRERAIQHGGVRHPGPDADTPPAVERRALPAGAGDGDVAAQMIPGDAQTAAGAGAGQSSAGVGQPSAGAGQAATPSVGHHAPQPAAHPATQGVGQAAGHDQPGSDGATTSDSVSAADPGATPYATPMSSRRAIALTGPHAVVTPPPTSLTPEANGGTTPGASAEASHPVRDAAQAAPTSGETQPVSAWDGGETRASRRRHRDDTEAPSSPLSSDDATETVAPSTASAPFATVTSEGETARSSTATPTAAGDHALASGAQGTPAGQSTPAGEPALASSPIPPGITRAAARAVASYHPPTSSAAHGAQPGRESGPSRDVSTPSHSPTAAQAHPHASAPSPLGSEVASGIAVTDAFRHRSAPASPASSPTSGDPAERRDDHRGEQRGAHVVEPPVDASERPRLPGVAELEASLRDLQRRRDNPSDHPAATRADRRRQRQAEADPVSTTTPDLPPVEHRAVAPTASPAASTAAPAASTAAPAASTAAPAASPVAPPVASPAPAAPLSRRARREADGPQPAVDDFDASLRASATHPGERMAAHGTSLPVGLCSTDDALAMTGGIPLIPAAHPEWMTPAAAASPSSVDNAPPAGVPAAVPAPGSPFTAATTGGDVTTSRGAPDPVWEAPMRARIDEGTRRSRRNSTSTDDVRPSEQLGSWGIDPASSPSGVADNPSPARSVPAGGSSAAPHLSVATEPADPASVTPGTAALPSRRSRKQHPDVVRGAEVAPSPDVVRSADVAPSANLTGGPNVVSAPAGGSIWDQMVQQGTVPTSINAATPVSGGGASVIPVTAPEPAPVAPSAASSARELGAHWMDSPPSERLAVADGWGTGPDGPSRSRTGASAADVAWLEQWERDHLQGPSRSSSSATSEPYRP